jgi:quinol monooxygenase YgiN
VIWGVVASYAGTRIALVASVVAMLVLQGLNRRVRVAFAEEADVTPGARLPDLDIETEPLPDDGPVLIQIEYHVVPGNRRAFLDAIHAIEPTRRRNGATSWRMFRDLEEDGRFVERYVLASWAEYSRLRTRMTQADRRLQDAVATLQTEGTPIRVSRFIGIGREDPGTG